MSESGWAAIGRVAKARRERLGLHQNELAQYGGPRVATVGKFERAAQPSFPLRTQHQIEKALGWTRGTIEDFVAAVEEDSDIVADWEHDLINDEIPDMSRPLALPEGALEEEDPVTGAVGAIAALFRLVDPERVSDALRDAVQALLPYLSMQGATELGRQLRRDYPPAEGGDGNAEESRGSAPTITEVDAEIIGRDAEESDRPNGPGRRR